MVTKAKKFDPVIIVGAGFGGLTTAISLSKRYPKPSQISLMTYLVRYPILLHGLRMLGARILSN